MEKVEPCKDNVVTNIHIVDNVVDEPKLLAIRRSIVFHVRKRVVVAVSQRMEI